MALAIATVIAYEPVRHNDFVNYDDNFYVFDNPNVTGGLTIKSVVWAFIHPLASNWHPLTVISHMLDCQLFGLKPFGHHLTNVLLHIAGTILLFVVLRKTTKAVWPSAFAAALFAVHPLHVESVAWGAAQIFSKHQYQKTVLTISAIGVTAALLICTRVQAAYWKDSQTLCERAIAVTENNFIIYYNHGECLYKKGRVREALTLFPVFFARILLNKYILM